MFVDGAIHMHTHSIEESFVLLSLAHQVFVYIFKHCAICELTSWHIVSSFSVCDFHISPFLTEYTFVISKNYTMFPIST